MDQALCSILCAHLWDHDGPIWGPSFYLRFNEDGTGEMNSIGDIGVWMFTLPMRWTIVTPSKEAAQSPFTPPRHSNPLTSAPQLLGQMSIEIIPINEVAPSITDQWKGYANWQHGRNLKPIFFRPKIHILTFEKGNFKIEAELGKGNVHRRRELRLTFDKTPYPTEEEVNDLEGGGIDTIRITQLLHSGIFLARELPKTSLKSRATNDDYLWGWRTSQCSIQ